MLSKVYHPKEIKMVGVLSGICKFNRLQKNRKGE
jgi:hypothetical protein